jgi:hypothetical protein
MLLTYHPIDLRLFRLCDLERQFKHDVQFTTSFSI